eukprot:TRINITY_DN4998_c0_g1_i1.p2 TRINITY_DN4998_c0_g1~~TRINITY_DN4998_c0_g1_i1.p2  ORF type:complete len:170 (+),score=91.62 TRINITY_DN4998_c0_g1_i1:66-575(+)
MAAEEAGAEEAVLGENQDIFYVCKKTLDAVKDKLKKGEEITQATVSDLTFPEELADDEMMVPVDMRGVGEDFDDVEQMVDKLGVKGTAEAFVKASEYFDANKDGEAPEDRPQPMTAAEWRQVLEDDVDLEGEEEEDFEGEEEALEELDEEAEEEGGDEEPPTKKAKVDV